MFDLCIIGGGITGAGIALDATLRGLKVILIEKNDFAFGTSSRSTKLIHGGLRYLKNGELNLVRTLGIERNTVHRLAPHLTVAEKMLTPIVQNGTYGYWLTSIGIAIYDVLAQVKRTEYRKMLDKKAASEAEPLLRTDILKGCALYYEYRTDDARLTIEIIKTAYKYGAKVLNYFEAQNLICHHDKVAGVSAKDLVDGAVYSIHAKCTINAAGPWVDALRQLHEPIHGKRLHLTKGVHLVVKRERLPVKQSVYFDVFDGRMVFVIPRGQVTYFGTTDTDYQGDISKPDITDTDKIYLINAINHMFPSANIASQDIISSWAGLRPLIHEEGKNTSEISRKDEVFISSKGLISIAGGKLTGYRVMAKKVIDLVINRLQLPYVACTTAHTKLECAIVPETIIPLAEKKLIAYFDNYKYIASNITHLYGAATGIILEIFEQLNSTDKNYELNLLKAKLKYSFTHEMIFNADDFFIRRSGIAYFEPWLMDKYKEEIDAYLKLLWQTAD
ncbi:MAG: glycerol-3-phosphate dehydrogenase/oxidase [Cytophagales bacterium]|nr:glycerol-3-phosphate dehydrogenase/oxidase [Cytophagales bacterium]